ncbi:MAG: hypothetical protein ACRDWE_14280 [Acidimicrobiales bacterium]
MSEPIPPPPGSLGAEDPAAQSAAAARIFLRPLATPIPLGFLGLFVASISMAGLELGWVPESQGDMVAIGILVLTVPVQLIACVYGFLARDLVAGTGMGVLAGTWALIALATLLSPPGGRSAGMALFIVMGGVALAVPAFAAGQSKLLAASVNLLTAVRWWVTAVYEFGAPHVWRSAAAGVGIALAALALYAALAFELEDQRRRTVLPTFRRRSGVVAMTGDLAAQVGRAHNEAGVRRQL